MLSSDETDPQVSRSLEYGVRVGLMFVSIDPIKLTALFTSIRFIHEMMLLPRFPFFLWKMGKAIWAMIQRPLRHKLVLTD